MRVKTPSRLYQLHSFRLEQIECICRQQGKCDPHNRICFLVENTGGREKKLVSGAAVNLENCIELGFCCKFIAKN